MMRNLKPSGRRTACAAAIIAAMTAVGVNSHQACAVQDDATAKEIAELKAEVATLKGRVQKTEAYIAIANLQRAYGFYVDKAQWDQAADLFSKNATLEISGRGIYVGNDHIRKYFKNLPGLTKGTVFQHLQMQPVITISADGKSAKARWRQMAQIGGIGRKSQIGEGIYENEYVVEDGVWKISKEHYYTNYLIDYQEGWAVPGEPVLGPFKDMPPDLPPTGDYKAYPDVSVPPYHYANPVTGRK
jgi:hypothetical protein